MREQSICTSVDFPTPIFPATATNFFTAFLLKIVLYSIQPKTKLSTNIPFFIAKDARNAKVSKIFFALFAVQLCRLRVRKNKIDELSFLLLSDGL